MNTLKQATNLLEALGSRFKPQNERERQIDATVALIMSIIAIIGLILSLLALR